MCSFQTNMKCTKLFSSARVEHKGNTSDELDEEATYQADTRYRKSSLFHCRDMINSIDNIEHKRADQGNYQHNEPELSSA